MITHPQDPALALWEVANEDHAPTAVRTTLAWARDYLSRPHRDLGRPGPVCPYVPSALRSALMYVAVQPGVPRRRSDVEATVAAYRDWFGDLDPRSGAQAEAKTILILFPDLPGPAMPDLIDRAQEALKPTFVEQGMMIGEFHPTPPTQPGLWNPAFRPLHSPVPLLAIRHMVPSDLPFLVQDRGFLRSYLQRFGDSVPARCREQLDEACTRFGLPLARALPTEVAGALGDTTCSVHWHDRLSGPIRCPRDVSMALTLPLPRITKTLLVRGRDGALLRLVTSVCRREVDLVRLGVELGIDDVRLASPAVLDQVLGQPPGGVSPLGRPEVPVVVDAELLRHPTVLVGAGQTGVDVELAPADLLLLSAATVLPFESGTTAAHACAGAGGARR